jgi:site-specific recombinase XerD
MSQKKTTLPTRRFDDWPEDLRAQWQRRVGATGWTRRYQLRVQRAVALWLHWCDHAPTEAGLALFYSRLYQDLAPASAASYCQLVAYGAPLVWPHDDWSGLRTMIASLQPPRRPQADKPRAPRTRKTMPLEDWPDTVKAAWTQARHPLLASLADSPHDLWSAAYWRRIERGLGRYLAWRGDAAFTVERGTVRQYVDGLEAEGLSPQTIGMYIEELATWMSVIFRPESDWRWLHKLARRYKLDRTSRRKNGRIVDSEELYGLGRRMMRRAEHQPRTTAAAILFRDGLMIALLARRPIRLSNLASLRFDDSLVITDQGAMITLARTKTSNGYTAPLSPELVKAVRRYRTDYHPVLAGDGDYADVWIGRDGGAMTARAISQRIRDVTRREIGRTLSPHLFRDCLATTAMMTSSEATKLAPQVLGHSDPRTTSTYYQHGVSAAAARTLGDILAPHRRPGRGPKDADRRQ